MPGTTLVYTGKGYLTQVFDYSDMGANPNLRFTFTDPQAVRDLGFDPEIPGFFFFASNDGAQDLFFKRDAISDINESNFPLSSTTPANYVRNLAFV